MRKQNIKRQNNKATAAQLEISGGKIQTQAVWSEGPFFPFSDLYCILSNSQRWFREGKIVFFNFDSIEDTFNILLSVLKNVSTLLLKGSETLFWVSISVTDLHGQHL